jgi:plasmid stabilization system protein ParE
VASAFQKVASNVSADRDLQVKAQEAITAAYNKEAQKRVAAIDTQQLQIKALLATGKISETESIALTSGNEQKKIDAQLEADEKAFKARKEIREKNAEEQKTQIARDRQIAEAQLAAASGDPSKVKALRAKEQPVLDEKIAGTSSELKEAQARQKSLLDLKAGGLATPETETQLQGVNIQVTQLSSQLNALNDQKGKLDGALKLSSATQEDLEGTIKQIGEVQTALAALQEKKSALEAAAKDGDTKRLSARQKELVNDEIEALLKTQGKVVTFTEANQISGVNTSLAEKQSQLRGLETKRDQSQAVLTASPEKAKSAQTSIADSDKKELDRKKSFQLQATEDERKQDEIRKAAAAKKATERAEAAIKGLDSQIKETLNTEKVGETQRLAQIAQLRKSGVKLESEIKLQETAERKRSVALELQLEQQKRVEIEKLEKKGIGVSKETKNANLIKVAELTKQLAETELAAIESLISAVRDRLVLESQKYAVTIEQQNLKLERQKLLYTALEKGLENQSRLAESANKLAQSTVALRESEFNSLNKIYDRQQAAIRNAGGQGNFADLELEEKKLILAEKLAVLKLNSLKEQQKFEAESLERDIQKRDLALERKKVENEIAIAKKKIDIAAQDAAIKSAELEVKLRPQSEEAKLKLAQARLGQDRNFLELGGLQQEKGFIADEARVNEIVGTNDRKALSNKQQGETNSAIGDVIAATRDPALQERLQQQQLSRLTQSTGRAALTTTDVSNAVAFASQPVNVRGADFKKPTSALLGQVEQGNTFTAAPAPAPDNTPFATSFEELARKYPDKSAVGSFDELNKKYPDKTAASFDELNKKYPDKTAANFDELNKKYPEKPAAEDAVKPEQAIVSSFDKLTQQIDQGFSNVLVAPDLKVKELTAGLEAQFDLVSKKITENPVKLTIDEDRLKKVQEDLSKPLAVFDEKQLERLEGIVGALGKGETNIANSKLVGAAAGGDITINAPTTINEAQQKAGNSREEFANVFNDILKKVGQVTAGVK